MNRLARRAAAAAAFASLVLAAPPAGRAGASTPPPPGPALPFTGLRAAPAAPVALVGATVHVSPERQLESATLVLRDGRVEAVGTRLDPPEDATVVELFGRTIYAGFVEPLSEYGLAKPAAGGPTAGAAATPAGGRARAAERALPGARSWNEAVHAERRAAESFAPDAEAAEPLLARGVTAAATVRRDGIFRGRAALVSLAPGDAGARVIEAAGPHHLAFTKGSSRQAYPSSLMGSIALVRQTLNDARWLDEVAAARKRNPALPAPATDAALAALAADLFAARPRPAVWFETTNEHDLLRAAAIGRELGLPLVHVGSGSEWRRLEEIAALGAPLVLPLRLPEKPDVSTADAELGVALADLRHWERAPGNAAALAAAGVELAFTGLGLGKDEQLLDQLRAAVRRGLPAERALAGLTTVPARLLGAADRVGSLEPGRRADLVIADGDLFGGEGRILEVWIGGEPAHTVEPVDQLDLRGRHRLAVAGAPFDLILEGRRPGKLEGRLEPAGAAGQAAGESPAAEAEPPAAGEPDAIAAGKEAKPARAKLEGIAVERHRVSFRADLGQTGGPAGVTRFAVARRAGRLVAEITAADGARELVALEPGDAAAEEASGEEKRRQPEAALVSRRTYPDAALGFETPPAAEEVVVRNATIWTSGPRGVLENADLHVRGGRVVAVGSGLAAPAGARVIDATGRHVTPGLIDEHSHLAISGGVNEGTHAVTSEVRIGDVIHPDDVGIYRALAGGTTAAQLLHGSANPIGGQAVVIKHRWGAPAEAMKLSAPPGIKFALGENVKQSNWSDASDRYPKSRMGVEARIRDAFHAAREAAAERRRYEALPAAERARALPPRRDLTLEALAEILDGRREIHCHSYVQSEILALIRLADELGFKVHTFTHILEGYKVAPEMAEHGAAGSSFADWWAYKFEVYDAIPQNTCLMHDAGVLVAVNSDSPEMIRRLNQEASKSVLHCGMDEADALAMVTLNPARMLGVADRIGSLEPGKDADFVIWSGHPLSTLSRPLETWIDGAPYFTVAADAARREADRRERRELVAKLLADTGGGGSPGAGRSRPPEIWHCDDLGGLEGSETLAGQGGH